MFIIHTFIHIFILFMSLISFYREFRHSLPRENFSTLSLQLLLALIFCFCVYVSYYGNFQSIKISYYLAPTKHKNLWLVYSTHTHTTHLYSHTPIHIPTHTNTHFREMSFSLCSIHVVWRRCTLFVCAGNISLNRVNKWNSTKRKRKHNA